jgi:Ca2+-binding EF-hand superfamily protein
MLSASEYAATFKAIDTDGDGLITVDELKKLLNSLGQPVTDDAAGTMLGFMDGDGDGKVTLDELKAYLENA